MIRQEQCDKVCRILDDVLANRPTERDSLIVAVQKAFDALERQRWIPCSERLPEDFKKVLVFWWEHQIFDRCEEIEAHLPEGDPDRTGYKMYPDYMTVWKYLHQLPSAQPEPRTAYWTKDIVGSVVCSYCGGIREDNRIGHTQWCNCCGCFMRGEEND